MAIDGLFTGSFDDAALFPPGNADMAAAIIAHDWYQHSRFADLVGPFVVPATRPYPLAHLRTGADSLAENRTQIVGLSVDLAANTPTVVATELVISSHAGI